MKLLFGGCSFNEQFFANAEKLNKKLFELTIETFVSILISALDINILQPDNCLALRLK